MKNPIEVQVKRKIISGTSVQTTNEKEMKSETAKLPELWSKFFQDELMRKISNQVNSSLIHGVYSSYESDVNGRYTVTAGMEIEDIKASSKAFNQVEIQAGKYLVFKGTGNIPEAVIDTWVNVWNYFSETNSNKRAYTTDFELYTGTDQINIYISVE
jgi:predicted transcriptional regulator YdeE